MAETTKVKTSDRDWLDAAGDSVAENEAVSGRYTYLGDGKSATFTPKTDDPATRMLAIFGALTLMGNLTNTWKIEKGDRAESPIDVIAERFALLTTGEWIDRTGGVGAKIDKDALANAIVAVSEGQGKVVDMAAIRAKLEDDPVWTRQVKSVPAIASKYAELVGRTVRTLDDLLSGV